MRLGGSGGEHGAKPPSKALMALLIVVTIAALAVVAKVGAGIVHQAMLENQSFEPSDEVLRKISPPGYTPYGQPPKPGEIRPPYVPGRG